MKKEYIEKIPTQEVKHKLLICDNPQCKTVIMDNGELLEKHFQMGNGKKLMDFCSEKCGKKITPQQG